MVFHCGEWLWALGTADTVMALVSFRRIEKNNRKATEHSCEVMLLQVTDVGVFVIHGFECSRTDLYNGKGHGTIFESKV